MKLKQLFVLLVFATCVVFGSICSGQSAFTFQILQPAANQIVATNLNVQVAVQSTYQLQSVTASIDGRTSNLVFSASTWTNSISLAGTTRGQKTLAITATDVFGGIGQTQVIVLKDLPPTLTVLEPLAGTVAHPTVHLLAQATDDNPVGAFINVFAGTNLLASGTNSIDAFVSIPDSEGQAVGLSFTAVDSVGQTVSASQTVYVFTSTNWVQAAIVEGPILDVTPDTILFVNRNKLVTKSRITGAETVLLDATNIMPAAGFLTPWGAIFDTTIDSTGYPYVYDLRAGTLNNLGAGMGLQLQGNFASWNYGFSFIVRYDLSAGTNTSVSTAGYSSCLASNGDVVYTAQGIKYVSNELWRFRNGTNSRLAYGSYYYYYEGPSSDGTNVVYEKLPYPMTTYSYVALNDGMTETLIGTNRYGTSSQTMNNGWVAYTDLGSGDVSQLWTRSSTGVRTQQSFFGTRTTIVALAPDGEVIMGNGGHLYQPHQGTFPTDLGAWNFGTGGKVFWQQERWYAQVGRSLFILFKPVVITFAGLSVTGGANLVLQGNVGDTVIVQASTNLINWSSFSTNTFTSGPIQVTDPGSAGKPFKFYRAMTPIR